MIQRDEVLAGLDRLITTGKRINGAEVRNRIPEHERRSFVSAAAAVDRIAGKRSEFYRHFPPLPGAAHSLAYHDVEVAVGVLIGLRDAVEAGFLASVESRIRASIEDDFLNQAEALLTSGFHPAAAIVLVGGVLEDRLRDLIAKGHVTVTCSGSLSKYNDALQKAGAYDQPTWRRIQSITDVRNNAAHGGAEAAKVKLGDVTDALNYVRRFLADHPS